MRETSLPLDWKVARIGVAFSLVGVGGADAPAVNEMIKVYSLLDDLSIGIGNGVAALGRAGNRFVGVRTRCWQVGCSLSAAKTMILTRPESNATEMAMCIGNGTTAVNSTVATNSLATASHNSAPSDTQFAVFAALQLTLTPTGLSASVEARSNVTAVDEVSLRQYLMEIDDSNPRTVSGGWWLNGDPVGMRHFMIRAPFAANRLRLHSLEVMQLA